MRQRGYPGIESKFGEKDVRQGGSHLGATCHTQRLRGKFREATWPSLRKKCCRELGSGVGGLYLEPASEGLGLFPPIPDDIAPELGHLLMVTADLHFRQCCWQAQPWGACHCVKEGRPVHSHLRSVRQCRCHGIHPKPGGLSGGDLKEKKSNSRPGRRGQHYGLDRDVTEPKEKRKKRLK